MATLGQKLAEEIREKSLLNEIPIAHICLRSGVSERSFRRWLSGENSPTIRNIEAMEKALSILIERKSP